MGGVGRRGQSFVIVAVAMVVLLGIAALSLTYAQLSYARGQVQNAVDAAALAGAQLASTGTSPTTDQAWLKQQNMGPDGTMTITDSRSIPDGIRATATVQLPAGFASLFGIKQFTVRETAVATYGAGAAFDYAVFQGDSTPSDPPLRLYGSDVVQGDAHSNDNLHLIGATSVQGSCTASGSATSTGAGGCDSGMTSGTPTVAMPVWTAAQLTAHATRVIGSPSNPTGYTFSGSTALGGNWVVYGSVTISGSITGPGSITAIGGSITIKGSAVMGSSGGVGVALSALPSTEVPNPGITLKGSHVISGILYAPAGAIVVKGSAVITGALVGYHVSTGGSTVVDYNASQQAAVPVQSVQLVQ